MSWPDFSRAPAYANRTVHSGVRGDDHDVTVSDRSTGCVDGLHFDTERSLAAVKISAVQPIASLTVGVTVLPPGWW
jgi:hypothetical protein